MQTAVATEPELLTLEEGAKFTRFDVECPHDPVKGFRRWLQRERVPVLRVGRKIRVERRVLLAFMRGEKWTERH